jgi:spheroidene monooxygenase
VQAVSLSVFRFDGLADRLWAFSQMQFAHAKLRAMPGLSFYKLFGTGTGEGFTPVPNFGVYAVLAAWPDLDRARASVADGRAFRDYRAHAGEYCDIYLSAVSSRGAWDGKAPFAVEPSEALPSSITLPSPIAVLTRATLKPRHVLAFWRHTPDISLSVGRQEHLRFKIGMGEVPWFQQVTFSIWDDPQAMTAFAYGGTAHREAVAQVRRQGYFKEELYARFQVLCLDGTWKGQHPLR